MQRTTYVIGHRNPDTDSIAAAMAYAALKRRQGEEQVVAAMAGLPNPQTTHLLARLGLAPPLLLADVRPRVRHVINRAPVTAEGTLPLKEALELFHRHAIRVLPVVDADRRPLGMVSLLKLSERYLVAGADRRRSIDAPLRSLARCLEADLLCGRLTEEAEHLHLFIGAMSEGSFRRRVAGYDPATLCIITGDRPSIQRAAIDTGVRLLLVTGGFAPSPELLQLAEERQVTVLSTPHDTASAAWLTRLSAPVASFADQGFAGIGVDEPLEQLRLALLHSGEPAVVALEEDGTIAGVATKSSLLAPIPFDLILVDHNELSQAVPGAEAVEILEIIDHHKLGNPPTSHPITVVTAPVGSSCTVVAGLYRERSLEPEPAMAALLMAGILSDTVILKSPTTTERDREMVAWLEPLAGLEHGGFGREIFSAGSGFSAHPSPEAALRADFKQFAAGDIRFGVGQVEVVGFDEFYRLKGELRQALARVLREERLQLAGLMVTDIQSETTLFLAEGMEQLVHVMGYPQQEPHLYELKGVMSRKKQMIPHLIRVLGAL